MFRPVPRLNEDGRTLGSVKLKRLAKLLTNLRNPLTSRGDRTKGRNTYCAFVTKALGPSGTVIRE
jgi:hypothetical protein